MNSLVSVSIPTYNSATTLGLCLESVKLQTYKQIEINIVDGGSSDKTIEIASKYGAKILESTQALLGARYEGVKAAKGEYVLLLDSDQILERDAIKRAVKMIEDKNVSMLVLEESVYKRDNWIEKLFDLDRQLIHAVKDFSPHTGVMLPRFYRKELLLKAFASVPKKTLREVGGQDHAIIYFEAWQVTEKVDLLYKAVKHIEPSSLRAVWRKFYRWGKTSNAAHLGKYKHLLESKESFRRGLFTKGYIVASLSSIALLILKGVPYKIGYYTGKMSGTFND